MNAITTGGDNISLGALRERYNAKRDALIAYLHLKVEEADWHGVSDAANDLRVLEAASLRSTAGQ